jgi:hypothetical protein
MVAVQAVEQLTDRHWAMVPEQAENLELSFGNSQLLASGHRIGLLLLLLEIGYALLRIRFAIVKCLRDPLDPQCPAS